MADSLIRPIAVNVNTGALTYTGSLTTNEITDGTIAPADLGVLAWGSLASGNYYYTCSQGAGTTGIWTAGQLRLAPFYLPNSVTLTRIGAEVTTVGDSGSKVRLGIYADTGTGYPGALVLDAGQIAGDSNTVQEITISQALSPGTYWFGSTSQSVSVTAPTLRAVNTGAQAPVMTVGTSTPSSNVSVVGYVQASVTGALPGSFTATPSIVSGATRVFVKVA